MRLDQILGGVDVLETIGDPSRFDVTNVCYDSREVRPGALFCCLPGEVSDGHEFASRAVEAGAVALLCERVLPLDVVQIRVDRARPAMARAAANLYGEPSRALVVAGVTGTNGKTTVSHLLASIFEANGWPTLVIGTLSGARTTPEAPELHGRLAEHLRSGGRAATMEVSSHALAQHRVDAVSFAAATFTNLSHDHLDYHGTMEAYFDAKARLFSPDFTSEAVVGVDDQWGRRLADLARQRGLRVHEYLLGDATDVECRIERSSFTWRGLRLSLPLGGLFNVTNAVAAATTAAALGLGDEAIHAGLAAVATVPGRMERVATGRPFEVVVDYAHTPDGLARVLQAARTQAEGHLSVVFGCGGDRDADKRPLMGEVAARLADLVVITSDNPRHEDPLAIIDAVVAGARGPGEVLVEPDRVAAISLALSRAQAGDVIVVAGKGHETGQQIGDDVIPMDDRAIVRQVLEVAS